MPLVIEMQGRGSPSVNKVSDVRRGFGSEKDAAHIFSRVRNVAKYERWCAICIVLPKHMHGVALGAQCQKRYCWIKEGNVAIKSWALGYLLLFIVICCFKHTLGSLGKAFWVSAITYTCPGAEILHNIVIFPKDDVRNFYYKNKCSVMISRIRLGLFIPGRYHHFSFIPQSHAWKGTWSWWGSGKRGARKTRQNSRMWIMCWKLCCVEMEVLKLYLLRTLEFPPKYSHPARTLYARWIITHHSNL